MNYYRDEGIVLKKIKLLKQQRLVTIFTKSRGKVTVLHFGPSSIKSKKLSHLETLNRIKFHGFESKGYIRLNETEVIDAYHQIKSDNNLIKNAYELLSIINNLLPENSREESIYYRLLNLLRNLTKNNMHNFYNELLVFLGYKNIRDTYKKHFDIYHEIETVTNKKIIKY